MNTTNEQLITQAVGGNKAALEQLIKQHEPFVYNVAWKYTNDPHEIGEELALWYQGLNLQGKGQANRLAANK